MLNDMEDMKFELTCAVDFPYTTLTVQVTELLCHCLSPVASFSH